MALHVGAIEGLRCVNEVVAELCKSMNCQADQSAAKPCWASTISTPEATDMLIVFSLQIQYSLDGPTRLPHHNNGG